MIGLLFFVLKIIEKKHTKIIYVQEAFTFQKGHIIYAP